MVARVILVCTLGTTWAVIPEAYAFMAPDRLPLFARHPRFEALRERRDALGLEEPAEIWVVTTDSERTRASLDQLRAWHRLLDPRPGLRVWIAAGIEELRDENECRRLRELVFRVVLRASARGPATLSLAGGRKTMSADVQAAAGVFGARALLHVISGDALPAALGNPLPSTLVGALEAPAAAEVTPVVVGSGERLDALDVDRDGAGAVTEAAFPLEEPAADGVPLRWTPPAGGPMLCDEVELRQREAARLLGNYVATVGRDERHENWRSLYRLPPARIDRLRTTVVDESHLGWLRSLPKADLHRHVGGALDLRGQRATAEALWAALSSGERDAAASTARRVLAAGPEPWGIGLKERLGPPGPARSAAAAALILETDDARLERCLWGATEPRRGLKHRGDGGFTLYELPGDLSGSTLLGHDAAVEPYAREAYAAARREGLRYLELRGSPSKYLSGRALDFVRLFFGGIAAARRHDPGCDVRFVFIVDRRLAEDAAATVETALRAKEELPAFVVGLDLAGDEQRGDFDQLARAFQPAFERCLPLTIHAGEGEAAANVWAAAYTLHADRVGHGLSLAGDPALAARFRDRRICLELCPTSNLEVVGYRDPRDAASADMAEYPLRRLYDMGLPLTVCTDNPGISRTDLAAELVAASRLSPSGLSQWEALSIVRQGFVHSFLPAGEREALLKEVDVKLFETLGAHDPEPR